jgi:hypothetical protein
MNKRDYPTLHSTNQQDSIYICNDKNKFRHSYYVTLAGLSFDHKTEICCFSSKYAEFRSKDKDLTGLLYQCASTINVHETCLSSRPYHHLIEK